MELQQTAASQSIPPQTGQVCTACQALLGQDSKDLGLQLCPKCRICHVCQREVLSKADLDYSLENNGGRLAHVRCLINSVEPLVGNITALNIARLKVSEVERHLEKTVELMTHDEIVRLNDIAVAIASAMSLTLARQRREKQAPKYDAKFQADREKAQQEREANNIKAPKAAKKQLTAEEKALDTYRNILKFSGLEGEALEAKAREMYESAKAQRKDQLK